MSAKEINGIPLSLKWGFLGMALVIIALVVNSVFGKSTQMSSEVKQNIKEIKVGIYSMDSRLKLVEYRLKQLENAQKKGKM